MTRKKPVTSTASVVRDYIDTHPSIKDGMRMGIMQALSSQRPSVSGVLRASRPLRGPAAPRPRAALRTPYGPASWEMPRHEEEIA